MIYGDAQMLTMIVNVSEESSVGPLSAAQRMSMLFVPFRQ